MPVWIRTVKVTVKTGGKSFSARGTFYSVTQCHLLERKDKVGASFNADCAKRNLLKLAFSQQSLMQILIEHTVPLAMCVRFIIPLPRQVGLVSEALWKEAEKLPAAA